jgi:hypothetical protein
MEVTLVRSMMDKIRGYASTKWLVPSLICTNWGDQCRRWKALNKDLWFISRGTWFVNMCWNSLWFPLQLIHGTFTFIFFGSGNKSGDLGNQYECRYRQNRYGESGWLPEHPKSCKIKSRICYVSTEWEFLMSHPQKGASLHFCVTEVNLWTKIALYSSD